MGNQQGYNLDFDQVSISTDKSFYFVGEIVSGNIYLNITKNGFPVGAVLVIITGKEQCQWIEQNEKQIKNEQNNEIQNETTIQTYSGKIIIFSHRIVIQKFYPGSLIEGQYTFPFEFQLPANIPGSFVEQKQSSYSAKIQYKVKAEIESSNKNFQNLKNTQIVIIREPLKQIEQCLMKEMEVKVKNWCCEDKGTCYIKCVCETNNYLRGDTACLWIDVDNTNCLLDVSRIEARLTKYLTLKDNTGRERLFTYVCSRSSIQGVQRGMSAQKMRINLLLKEDHGQQEIQPSSNGQLIKAVYRLEAIAILSQICICSTDPTVDIPLQIIAKNHSFKDNTQLKPRNWNPQIFKKTIISFTESTKFTKNQSLKYNYTNSQQLPPSKQFGQMNQLMS